MQTFLQGRLTPDEHHVWLAYLDGTHLYYLYTGRSLWRKHVASIIHKLVLAHDKEHESTKLLVFVLWSVVSYQMMSLFELVSRLTDLATDLSRDTIRVTSMDWTRINRVSRRGIEQGRKRTRGE